MNKYLGEESIDQKDSPYKDYTKSDWALEYIFRYGQIGGDHHKKWVLDQVTRILNGTKIIIKLASWSNGESEYRITLDEPSNEYTEWVTKYKDGEDGSETYSYDEGICP